MSKNYNTNKKYGSRPTKETQKQDMRKSRKSKSEPRSKYGEELDKQEKEQNYNNRPSMYFKDRDLADQVSSFSLNQFLEVDGKPFTDPELQKVRVPAIMTLYFNPSPGYTRGTSTAEGGINIAAMKAYTKLSSMNAKTTQYAPQDVATLMLALGEVIAISETIRRAFRLVFLYNKRNWNYPKAVLNAMGLNVDDFIQKLADYRLEFNATINMINQISFPGDIEWFDKCKQMFSHIYTDSESPMAQSYVFMPATTWILDETSYEEGTILKTTPFALNNDGTGRFGSTMSAWIGTLNRMIQAILNSATFNYIYADVLRLVNPGRLMVMPYLTEGETIEPEYDPMILLQIENATMVVPPQGTLGENTTPDNDVYPKVDNNAVFYAPTLKAHPDFDMDITDTVINFPHSMGNPDVDQRIEVTRMITLFEGDGTRTDVAALADHYLVGWYMPASVLTAVYNSLSDPWYDTTQPFSANWAKIIMDFEKFEHAPRVKFFDANGNINEMSGAIDFFTTINLRYLKKVNDLAYVTLFEVEL